DIKRVTPFLNPEGQARLARIAEMRRDLKPLAAVHRREGYLACLWIAAGWIRVWAVHGYLVVAAQDADELVTAVRLNETLHRKPILADERHGPADYRLALVRNPARHVAARAVTAQRPQRESQDSRDQLSR